MRKGYSYIRMSTDIQLKGDSLRRQMEMSKKYCENNNIELMESIQDIGVSGFRGKNTSEGSLGKFLNLVESGSIERGSVLIIESLDRLSRDKVLAAFSLFTGILNSEITIVTLQDNQVYTNETISENPGQLFLSLGVMLRAHDESQTKSNRMSSVWNQKRLNAHNKILTTRSPAWLKPNKNKDGFDIIKDAVNTVCNIFQWSINGDGAIVITRRLNDSGTPSIGRAEKWNRSYVLKILHNRAVIGECQPKKLIDGVSEAAGEPIKSYFPEIISEADFINAQHRMRDRTLRRGRRGKTFSNLFSGLVYCASCGDKLSYFDKGKKNKPQLLCLNRFQHKGCISRPWTYKDFEDTLISSLSEMDLSQLIDVSGHSKNKALRDRITLVGDELKQESNRLQENIALWLDSEPTLKKLLEPRMTAAQNDIEEKNELLESLKNEYQTLSLKNVAHSKNRLGNYNAKISSLTSDDEIFQFRSSVSQALNSIISKAYVDTSMVLNPWELADVDSGFMSVLKRKRYKTQSSIENYLNTDHGKRAYVEYERSIRIVFKTGKTGWIKPSKSISVRFDKTGFK